jgi:hypothetical protein
LSILLQVWFMVGAWGLVWAARKLIGEEERISSPDRSFYRRNDNDLLRLIIYFVLWCSTGTLLWVLWLYTTGQLHINITGHGA